MEELINGFNSQPFLDDALEKGLMVVIKLCRILFPLCALWTLGFAFAANFVRAFPERPKAFVPWTEIATVTVLFCLILFYTPIFGSIGRLAFAMNNSTAPDMAMLTQNNAAYKKYLDESISRGSTSEENKNSEATKEIPSPDFDWTGFFLDPSVMFASFLSGITTIIITILEYIIRIATILLGKVLYLIGPLAICFSVIPAFRGKLGEWFGTYLNILLIGTTMNLIEFVIKGSFFGVLKGFGTVNQYNQDPLAHLVFNIACIIVYCYSFWVTSKWVGSNDAGRVVMSGIQTAASMGGNLMAAKFGGAAAGAMQAGGSAAGALENTTKVTKDLSQ